jgi:hypothetical protein
MGVFPQPFLSRMQPAVELTLKRILTAPPALPAPSAAEENLSGEQPDDGR